MENTKLCCRCQVKPRSSKNSPYCRECMREYYKEYYQKNIELFRERGRRNKEKRIERTRKLKQKLVEQKGGKCERCGYDKNYAALVFHHPNERKGKMNKKRQGLIPSENPQSSKFDIKAVTLVCENCHKEIHFPDLQKIICHNATT